MEDFNKIVVYEFEGENYDITDVIFSFIYSLDEEDYLNCKEIKEGVDDAIKTLNEEEKESLGEYINQVLQEYELEDHTHIRALFKEIL